MLKTGPVRQLHALRLNPFLPFQISTSTVLMTMAALGAIAGMFFFFHGFSLLQERRLSRPRPYQKRIVHTATITTTLATADVDVSKCDSHEVIQLTPVESLPNGSTSMTQQGKIAAALLRAGIPNPVTWSAQTEVRVVDPPDSAAAKATASKVSTVLEQDANADPSRLPDAPAANSADWKSSLMIWGGPALTLGCVYALASHFGWL